MAKYVFKNVVSHLYWLTIFQGTLTSTHLPLQIGVHRYGILSQYYICFMLIIIIIIIIIIKNNNRNLKHVLRLFCLQIFALSARHRLIRRDRQTIKWWPFLELFGIAALRYAYWRHGGGNISIDHCASHYLIITVYSPLHH